MCIRKAVEEEEFLISLPLPVIEGELHQMGMKSVGGRENVCCPPSWLVIINGLSFPFHFLKKQETAQEIFLFLKAYIASVPGHSNSS